MLGCTTCRVQDFGNRDLWKEHHRSDFHRYNLKRRAGELPPVSESLFLRKLELLQATTGAAKGDAHIKQKAASAVTSSVTSAVTSAVKSPSDGVGRRSDRLPAESETLGLNSLRCLFDETVHSSAEENLKHMEDRYQFFLVDKEYIVDLDAFLKFLVIRVYEEFQCIYCRKQFSGVYALRDHMLATNHTLVGVDANELEDDYHQFYDFSASYKKLLGPDATPEMIEQIEKLAAAMSSKVAVEDEDQEDEDEAGEGEWEDIDDDDSDEASGTGIPDQNWDAILEILGLSSVQVTPTGHLRLPSGKEIAPRQLMYIYKQRLRPTPLRNAIVDKEISELRQLRQSTTSYRQWVSKTVSAEGRAAKQRQTARFDKMWQRDKRNRRLQWELSNEQMRLGVKANKLNRIIKRDNLVSAALG